MSMATIRVRLILPGADESVALGVSAATHFLLIALLLPLGGGLGSSGPLRPARPIMAVDLATPAARREPAKRPERLRKPPAQKPKPEAKPKPVSKRTEVDAPKTVVERPEGTTAQPEALPEAEPQPELPPVPADGPEPGPDEGAAPGDAAVAETGVASAAPGGLFEDHSFRATWYERLVFTRLQDAWRDRPMLPAGRDSLRTVVAFRIMRSGEVRDIDVVIPSGYAPLDLSSRRAVDSLKRLPALPRDYAEDSVRARVVFVLAPDRPR